MKKIHCFRHVPFEGLGCIKTWCDDKSYPVVYTNFFEENYILPSPEQYDALIIMGGPMGIYDEDKHPWLTSEKIAIRQAIDSGKTVIGICLGSQLIANALGAKVYPNNEKEIGWWQVSLTEEAKKIAPFDAFDNVIDVFQWHGDTFDIPAGAIKLASSIICENQAFIYNERVIALQFHFEVTQESISVMNENDLGEISAGGSFVQTAETILSGAKHIKTNNQMMFAILDKLIG